MLCVAGLFPAVVSAQSVYFVDDVKPYSVIDVPEDAEVARAYYGELRGAPDTFEIVSAEDFELFVQVAAPEIDGIRKIYNGIIVEVLNRGGVVEVARLPSGSVEWQSDYEFSTGDSYLRGPSYTGKLSAGVYRVEVSTPENYGKYVLFMGTRHESEYGLLAAIGNLFSIKKFFEKSTFAVLQSPYFGAPLLLFLIFTTSWYIRRRRGAVITGV